jgi:hypothetical protein
MTERAYKVTLLVLNLNGDCNTKEELIQELENLRHPEFVTVMDVKSREIEWSDDHPLNQYDTQKDAFEKLFQFDGDDVIGGKAQ